MVQTFVQMAMTHCLLAAILASTAMSLGVQHILCQRGHSVLGVVRATAMFIEENENLRIIAIYIDTVEI